LGLSDHGDEIFLKDHFVDSVIVFEIRDDLGPASIIDIASGKV
jgi:hypothetical protein